MSQSFNSFLGTGWAFPPAFDNESGTVNMVSNEEDIRESLNILLSTSLGERVMQPKYGCNLIDYLFEPLSSSMIGFIKDRVENSILFYEPRIIAEKIEVTDDGGGLNIGLSTSRISSTTWPISDRDSSNSSLFATASPRLSC